MGLLDKFIKKESLPDIHVDDNSIVALANGRIIDVKSVGDCIFADELMGKTIAFAYDGDSVTLCSPANGILSVLYPTGHAFGITCHNGVEILVHCGVNTVDAKGQGFKTLSKKQGDHVKAGDPIVTVNLKELAKKYEMSTMMIITNTNDHQFEFQNYDTVNRGDILIKVQ